MDIPVVTACCCGERHGAEAWLTGVAELLALASPLWRSDAVWWTSTVIGISCRALFALPYKPAGDFSAPATLFSAFHLQHLPFCLRAFTYILAASCRYRLVVPYLPSADAVCAPPLRHCAPSLYAVLLVLMPPGRVSPPYSAFLFLVRFISVVVAYYRCWRRTSSSTAVFLYRRACGLLALCASSRTWH